MADIAGVDLDSITTDPKKAVAKSLSQEFGQAKRDDEREKNALDKYQTEVGELKQKGDAITAKAKSDGTLSPPQLTDYKPPAPTDPWAQWGSPAMWLAGLSSIMGRRSLTRALSTGGAYLNAVKEGDQANAKQAFDAWKQSNENAVKMHEFQMDAYKEAMKNLRDDKEGAHAEVETVAYALAHDPMLQALKEGRESAISIFDTMTRHGDELKRMQPELEDHAFRAGMQKKVEQIQAKRDQDLQQPGADPKTINAAATAAVNDLSDQSNMYFGRSGTKAAGAGKGTVTLTPDQIDNLYNGRARMSDYGIRGDERAAVLAQVTASHPDFDTRLYDIRKGVMKGYMDPNGTANKNIVASNTAIGHVAQLRELAGALKAGDNQIANKYINYARTTLGHPEVTTANMAITAIGEEMMKSFRQVGASEKEAEEWKHNLDVATFSPEQADKATKEAMEILMPRLDTLNENWKTDMGQDQDFAGLFTPNTRSILEDLDINYPGRGKPAPSSPSQQKATSGPAAGAVVNGYRFKGGDPHDQKNWEKAAQ